MRNIRVVPHDPTWHSRYEEEAALLRAIFGDALMEIHHIGSTSVAGLLAKPIIDIMPVVHDVEVVDSFNAAMAAIGYEAMGENEIAGRRYFRKGGQEVRSHHVHVYAAEHPEVAAHLRFRDYLRTHPDDAYRYGVLKAQIATQNPHDIFGYMAGKDTFVKELIAKAHEWHHNGRMMQGESAQNHAELP